MPDVERRLQHCENCGGGDAAIRLLRELQWSGTAVDQDGRDWQACPCCKGIEKNGRLFFTESVLGHRHDCELAKQIGAPRAEAPRELRPLAWSIDVGR